ncbi:MAG: Ig-like domain-containing protein [Planctomycetota bacterium]|jgi:hypothetical protein
MREFRIAHRGWGALGVTFAVVLLAACTGAASPEPSRIFEVAYVSPPDGFVLADQPSEIQFVFTRKVDPGSVSDRSIRLVAEDGTEVRGKRSVSILTPSTVNFMPVEELERGTPYIAVASTDVRDAYGQRLQAPYTSALVLSSPRSGNPGSGAAGSNPTLCPDPVGRTVYFATDSVLMAVDTENGSEPYVPNVLIPSSRLHDCQRWYLEWIVTGITTPNGEPARGLRARSESGERVTLMEPDENRTTDTSDYPLRWAKDDSFVSLIALDWSGADVSSHIVRIPVAWNDGRPEADPLGEEKFVPSSTLGPADSAIHVFDWSPSGMKIVYSRILASTGESDIYLHDVETRSSKFLSEGDWPAWSSSGPDELAPIAFSDYEGFDPGLHTIYCDGSSRTRITPYWSSTGGNMRRDSPVWSPEGGRIAMTRTEGDLAVGGTRTWAIEIYFLATESFKEISEDPVDFLVAWR